MKHMKLSAKETKAQHDVRPAKGNQYPWGLSMHLEHDSLAKLGVKGAPKAGTVMEFRAKAHVSSSSSSSEKGGKGPRHSASLQITHLEVDPRAPKALKSLPSKGKAQAAPAKNPVKLKSVTPRKAGPPVPASRKGK